MRVGERIRRNHELGKKSFIAYLTAGDPSLGATESFVKTLSRNGVDVLSWGFPIAILLRMAQSTKGLRCARWKGALLWRLSYPQWSGSGDRAKTFPFFSSAILIRFSEWGSRLHRPSKTKRCGWRYRCRSSSCGSARLRKNDALTGAGHRLSRFPHHSPGEPEYH